MDNCYTVYVNILAGQKFHQAQLLLYCRKKFVEKIFAKVVHVKITISPIYVIFNTGQKFSVIKYLPIRTRGKIGTCKFFSW